MTQPSPRGAKHALRKDTPATQRPPLLPGTLAHFPAAITAELAIAAHWDGPALILVMHRRAISLSPQRITTGGGPGHPPGSPYQRRQLQHSRHFIPVNRHVDKHPGAGNLNNKNASTVPSRKRKMPRGSPTPRTSALRQRQPPCHALRTRRVQKTSALEINGRLGTLRANRNRLLLHMLLQQHRTPSHSN